MRQSRETQNYSLDQVARDTRISKRYIESLESEEFSQFPGETYLVGFLRNYTQYLGLDSDEFVNLYRNIKLQEQPLPMDELIHGKKTPPHFLLLIGALVVLGLIVLGSFFLVRLIQSRQPLEATQAKSLEGSTAGQEFLFEGESETRWFKTGDVIMVVLGGKTYRMEVHSIDEGVSLSIPGGSVRLKLSEARFIDLNLDLKNDLKVVFNDIDSTEQGKRVNLWLIKAATLMKEDTSDATPVTEAAPLTEATPVTEAAPVTEATPRAVVTEGRIVILEADAPRIFKVDITFRGDCLLRYLMDGEARDQRFFQKGESFSVDRARKELKLWISNAGILEARIEGKEVSLGRPGQVVTKLIRWVKSDRSSRYQLEIVSVF